MLFKCHGKHILIAMLQFGDFDGDEKHEDKYFQTKFIMLNSKI